MPSDKHLKTYAHMGVKIQPGANGEATAICPFCSGSKFSINTEEGLFYCFNPVCNQKGNKYTFLQRWYEQCLENTEEDNLKILSERKNLPVQAFIDSKVAYDRTNSRWIIPVHNNKGGVVNLRLWTEHDNMLKQTAGCKGHLYNQQELINRSENVTKVYLLEGEWDAIAFSHLLSNSREKDYCVVAVPGAASFKEEWATYFYNMEVVVLFDKDPAGVAGAKRLIKKLQDNVKTTSISWIVWPEEYKEGYDIRDYVSENLDKPNVSLRKLKKYLQPAPNFTDREKIQCKTFSQLVKQFEKHIYMSSDMKDGLLLICSVIASNSIPGDPLWLFVVGPPGSGKTLLLQSCSESENTSYQSSLGAKTLISGYKTKDGSDPSLLPKIIGKTLILKDYTEIMDKPASEQDDIFSQLRGAYDGQVQRDYGHGEVRTYPPPGSPHKDCRFTLLAGVTNAIHGNSKADLGERFLKYQMVSEDYDPILQVKAAIANTVVQKSAENNLQEPFTSFMENLSVSKSSLPKTPDWVIERIIGLAQFVSTVRAKVNRKAGEIVYRPVPEVATRLSKQLIKLGQCICIVLKKKEIDEECYSLVCKVALDTCYGWHRDILFAVAAHHPQGIKRIEAASKTSVPASTAQNVLNDLLELGAVTFDIEDSGEKGKPAHLWMLSDSMKELIDLAELQETSHSKILLEASLDKSAPIKRKRNSTKRKYVKRKAKK